MKQFFVGCLSLISILIFILIIIAIFAHYEDREEIRICSVDAANIRYGPGTEYKKDDKGPLKWGDTLYVLDRENGWLRFRLNPNDTIWYGWVRKDLTVKGSRWEDIVREREKQLAKRKSKSMRKMRSLKASIGFDGTQFMIVNNDHYDWTTVKMEINAGIIRGGYKLRVSIIAAGETYYVNARRFTKRDGTMFNPLTTRPMGFDIYCDQGDWFGKLN